MKNILFYLRDNKSGEMFYPFFAPNEIVALRSLASEIKRFRENKSYSVLSIWEDSDLYFVELDADKVSNPVKVDGFRVFWGKENENKNVAK